MNIAFDAISIEVGKGSGVGNYTMNQLKAMVELSPENNYFYFNTVDSSNYIKKITTQNIYSEYFYLGKDHFSRKQNMHYSAIVGELIKNFIKEHDIDVFYITNPFHPYSFYQKEWFNDVTVIATVYDIIPYIMRKQYLPSKELLRWYMSCVEMVRWADKVMVISNSVLEDMVKYFDFDPQKIDVIYGGVSEKYRKIHIQDSDEKNIFDKFGINSEFVMCSVSADQRKNIEGIIESYGLLSRDIISKYQLVIVGRLLPENMHKYEVIIQKYNLNGRVILTDYVTDDEIVMLYNLAKLMVFPSLYEGFGLPIVEAWACGTPVLASNNSSLGEITLDAGLLFDPYSKKDMARGLTEALTSANLDSFVKKGTERVKEFTWDRVARLTLKGIENAVKQKNIAKPSKQNIACVFLQQELYSKALLNVISKLSNIFDIDLVTDIDKDIIGQTDRNIKITDIKSLNVKWKSYEHIIYFISEDITQNSYEIIEAYSGICFVLDPEMAKIIDIISEKSSDELDKILALKVSKHLQPELPNEMSYRDIYKDFVKIITANSEIKNIFVQKSLNIQSYNVCPLEDLDEYKPNQNSENLSEIFVANIVLAINDSSFIKDKVELIEEIRKELIPQNYTDYELRQLSRTLGYTFNTDNIMKKASIYENDKRLKVDMITTWNIKCGIAEYTKYYVNHVSDHINFSIYPNKVDDIKCLSNDDSKVKGRLWEFKKDLDSLALDLLKSDSEVVHIQYTEGFFSVKTISELIKFLNKSKRIIITCHNSKFFTPNSKDEEDILNTAKYVVHQEDDKQNLIKSGIKEKNINVISLAKLSTTYRDKSMVKSLLGIETKKPVIGSYGFLLPHKGIYEIIQAISILKNDYPDILFLAVCSLYDVPLSKEYYFKCLQLVKERKLDNNVKLITDFLEPEESMLLLQGCDAFVMPYAETTESSSGAARFCVAAKRPMVVTKLPIFKEFEHCTYQIDKCAPQDIVAGVKTVLDTENYDKYTEAIVKEANESTWQIVGERYIKIYNNK